MLQKEIFLETSAQIEKIFGYGEIKKEIQETVADKSMSTSTYVEKEFKGSILRDFVFMYNVIQEEDNLSKAFNRLSQQYGRKSKNYLKILSIISRDGNLSKNRVLLILRRYIESTLLLHFHRGVNKVLSETRCTVAKRKPVYQNRLYDFDSNCRIGEANCNIKSFIKKNIEDIILITTVLKEEVKKRKKYKEIYKNIEVILKDIDKVEGQKCSQIGDIIISIECPKSALLYTKDKVYKIICPPIGREVLTL